MKSSGIDFTQFEGKRAGNTVVMAGSLMKY